MAWFAPVALKAPGLETLATFVGYDDAVVTALSHSDAFTQLLTNPRATATAFTAKLAITIAFPCASICFGES
jgi:hypothetical protein